MGLFPPWIDHYNPLISDYITLFSSGDYGFLLAPPRKAAFVDLTRLIPQWLMLSVLTGWMVYIRGDKNLKAKNNQSVE
jgi:hypothetical protein